MRGSWDGDNDDDDDDDVIFVMSAGARSQAVIRFCRRLVTYIKLAYRNIASVTSTLYRSADRYEGATRNDFESISS
jgi:hypothetical protein